MKQKVFKVVLALLYCSAGLSPAYAGSRCTRDMMKSGTTCVDTYEASVWRIPNPLDINKSLVKKVQKGRATAEALTAGGATQLGTAGDDYAPCNDDGQNCTNDIYAVSVSGVQPARSITWFQAQLACKNAQKRLPSDAEWQSAVAGTPDGAPCNVASAGTSATGSAAGCISSDGAFDMVGNLFEWVADWVPLSTACVGWGSFSDDQQCLAGADTSTTGGPGAVVRGGHFAAGSGAGPLNVVGNVRPSDASAVLGFRCAR